MQYIANGAVSIDGVDYSHGATIELENPAMEASLRKVGALLLPNEVKSPEQVAVDFATLQNQNDQLASRALDLEAQLDAALKQLNKGKNKATETPAV